MRGRRRKEREKWRALFSPAWKAAWTKAGCVDGAKRASEKWFVSRTRDAFQHQPRAWIQVFRASSAQIYSVVQRHFLWIPRKSKGTIDAKLLLASIANWHARCWWTRASSLEWMEPIHATASLRINFTFHVPFCSLSFSRVSSSLRQVYRRSIVEIERDITVL